MSAINAWVRRVFGVVALAALFGAGAGASGTGRPVPSVSFHLSNGTAIEPANFKGKVLLIDFWASWCVSCKTAFPALDKLYQEQRPRGFEVLAVNLDERQKDADAFLADRPHVMPVVFDPMGQSAKAFGIQGMPSSVLIDRAGVVRFTHMGYSSKVLDDYRSEISALLSEK